jgi:hypothetical protein
MFSNSFGGDLAWMVGMNARRPFNQWIDAGVIPGILEGCHSWSETAHMPAPFKE